MSHSNPGASAHPDLSGRLRQFLHQFRIPGKNEQIAQSRGHLNKLTTMLQSLPAGIDTLWLDAPWGQGPGDYSKRPVIYLEDLQLAWLALAQLPPQDTPGDEFHHAIEQSIKSLPENDEAWLSLGRIKALFPEAGIYSGHLLRNR